jgi:hypothetical protein
LAIDTHDAEGGPTVTFSKVIAGAFCLLLFAGPVQAVPIRYTLTGTASGSLGGTPFSNSAFTVILDGDTDSVTTWGGDGTSTYSFFGPGFSAPGSVASIQIDGLPLANFTTAVEIFLAQAYTAYFGSPLLSFGRPNSNTSLPGWVGMAASGLAGVSLGTEFVSLNSGVQFCSTTGPMNLFTDRGTLLASGPCGNTLVSVTSQYLAPVPLPGGAWLVAGALCALGAARRKAGVSG